MGISKEQFNELMQRPGIAKANNQAGLKTSVTQLECPAGPPLESPPKDKASGTGQCEVRIRSFRCRLQDPDNESVKYAIDQLRYSGVLANDTQAEVLLVIEPQVKVATEAEERTEITLTWL